MKLIDQFPKERKVLDNLSQFMVNEVFHPKEKCGDWMSDLSGKRVEHAQKKFPQIKKEIAKKFTLI